MSISIQNVTKLYGEQKAVNQINFEIPKGQIVGFLGPNGAGKSTTMKMITGFIAPTDGVIKVCGIDVIENPIETKRKIGYLPESNPLYFDMYVREYLEFMAHLHKLAGNGTSRIEEMVHLTGLEREAHKKIGALSKGYKQRVGLAQAILHNPEVLILDEPTSGLDPNQIIEIRELICNIGKEKTVLLSTHIMQEVSAMCTRAIIINKGNIVADNSIEDLQNNQLNNNTAVIISTKQALDKNIFASIASLENILTLSSTSLKILTSQPEEVKKEMLKICINHNLDIESIQSETTSLEDVFRKLTL